MKVADLPEEDSLLYPVAMSIRISLEMKAKLEKIKEAKKSPIKAVRKFIEEGLNNIEDLEV